MNAQTFEFSQTRPPLEFRPMLAGDAMLLSLQPSQQFELGLEHKSYSLEEGEDLAENGLAWTAYRGATIVTIAGFREIFPGHAIVWAALSDRIGADHLAITRFARQQIANAPYRRLEAIVDADNTRAVAWAKLVGLELAHVLRCYGREGKTHFLFERISEDTPCKPRR
jgi:hypothetical protein